MSSRKSLPLTWRLLGAKPVKGIYLREYPINEREQIQYWFPEAEIHLQ